MISGCRASRNPRIKVKRSFFFEFDRKLDTLRADAIQSMVSTVDVQNSRFAEIPTTTRTRPLRVHIAD
jgi:hypothetical protein